MTSIRIAFATALALGALFAGGSAHSAPSSGTHTAILTASAPAPQGTSPVLCCGA